MSLLCGLFVLVTVLVVGAFADFVGDLGCCNLDVDYLLEFGFVYCRLLWGLLPLGVCLLGNLFVLYFWFV